MYSSLPSRITFCFYWLGAEIKGVSHHQQDQGATSDLELLISLTLGLKVLPLLLMKSLQTVCRIKRLEIEPANQTAAWVGRWDCNRVGKVSRRVYKEFRRPLETLRDPSLEELPGSAGIGRRPVVSAQNW